MSGFKIDHIVLGSKTLEEGSEYIQDLLNVKLSSVGKHKIMGTHNRVLKLGTLYLEIISLDPSSEIQVSDCWFGLNKKYVQEEILKKPNLISFVISSKEDRNFEYYNKKIFVQRDKLSWNFRRPKKSSVNKNLFSYADVFPSIINWISESPLGDMTDNSLLFSDLEIKLNYKQSFYVDFIKKFNLEEKISFNFTDTNSLTFLPKLKANIINTKNKKVFSIN